MQNPPSLDEKVACFDLTALLDLSPVADAAERAAQRCPVSARNVMFGGTDPQDSFDDTDPQDSFKE
jgi:hypothetical protein